MGQGLEVGQRLQTVWAGGGTRQQRPGQRNDLQEREAGRAVWGPQTLEWADADLT